MGRGGLRFSLSLSFRVMSDVIMSDVDCTPGHEPRSVAASYIYIHCCTQLKFTVITKCAVPLIYNFKTTTVANFIWFKSV